MSSLYIYLYNICPWTSFIIVNEEEKTQSKCEDESNG